jgi:hypothetical protein
MQWIRAGPAALVGEISEYPTERTACAVEADEGPILSDEHRRTLAVAKRLSSEGRVAHGLLDLAGRVAGQAVQNVNYHVPGVGRDPIGPRCPLRFRSEVVDSSDAEPGEFRHVCAFQPIECGRAE